MSKFPVPSARCSKPKRKENGEHRDRKHCLRPEDDVRGRARNNGNATRMDVSATITREPIRKRAKIGNKCTAWIVDTASFPTTGIASLPVEIIFKILSYLAYKDLCTVRRLSLYFEQLARDPFLWRTYEVTNNEQDTMKVITELKRMPLLRTFSISVRADCDEILRQLPITNKRLEELHVTNCTGSTSKLYLRSAQLIRILERCRNLHTINILGNRFRGRKFYRLLAGMGQQLRTFNAPATSLQFCTFIKCISQITEEDRQTICSICAGSKNWEPLYYFLRRRSDRDSSTILISYLSNDIVLTDVGRPTRNLSITVATRS
ncbi:uncharacterized protein LOC128894020 [Hylaeus anthracinus]|uniref:uncharacterized protein LOC128879910 n=1 Tax=Hylaeus volcanicus TaxID=313075 RepID=UPI0023B782DE|nr:uncharacterized protein LOC128879910 [Hylaeus volcanicus]XP_054011386.1 uncharacterized protein LOC128894020 [Hylaeus anthracinus]